MRICIISDSVVKCRWWSKFPKKLLHYVLYQGKLWQASLKHVHVHTEDVNNTALIEVARCFWSSFSSISFSLRKISPAKIRVWNTFGTFLGTWTRNYEKVWTKKPRAKTVKKELICTTNSSWSPGPCVFLSRWGLGSRKRQMKTQSVSVINAGFIPGISSWWSLTNSCIRTFTGLNGF